MHEFEFIASLLAPLTMRAKGALGLTDDAAIVKVPGGQELVVTKDAIVEGIHFIGNEPPNRIAQKALRVNLSDLAAMGAKPYGYFLALMLPGTVDEAWLKSFAKGLVADQKTYGITLMGGDTTRTHGKLSLSITALGLVPTGKALLRRGARPGDDIYVSGTIGDAALGLLAARGELNAPALLKRYQLPEPRIELGQKLRGIATSCIDISDGLLQDLGHICEVSNVAAEIELDALPLSNAARKALASLKDTHDIILAGGDDYELLFTAPPRMATKLKALSVKLTKIGRIGKGNGVFVVDGEAKEIALARKGYQHF